MTNTIKELSDALARNRVQFYQKVKMALEDGYCIMPDLPVQLLAVRTDLNRPRKHITKSRYSYGVRVPEVESNSPQAGQGHYVDPRPLVRSWHQIKKDEKGNEITTHFASPVGFEEEFDFPVRLACCHALPRCPHCGIPTEKPIQSEPVA